MAVKKDLSRMPLVGVGFFQWERSFNVDTSLAFRAEALRDPLTPVTIARALLSRLRKSLHRSVDIHMDTPAGKDSRYLAAFYSDSGLLEEYTDDLSYAELVKVLEQHTDDQADNENYTAALSVFNVETGHLVLELIGEDMDDASDGVVDEDSVDEEDDDEFVEEITV